MSSTASSTRQNKFDYLDENILLLESVELLSSPKFVEMSPHDMPSYIEECVSEGKHGFLETDIEWFFLAVSFICVKNAILA